MRVGDENDGWRLAKVTLSNERVSLSSAGSLWGAGPSADELIDLIRQAGRLEEPVLRDRAARLRIEARLLHLNRMRSLSATLNGRTPGPEASIQKIMADEHGQHVMSLAKDLAGANGMLTGSGPVGKIPATMQGGPTENRFAQASSHQFADVDPIWHYGYLFHPALTLGGGTFAVQRNIVAEHVLGLPAGTGCRAGIDLGADSLRFPEMSSPSEASPSTSLGTSLGIDIGGTGMKAAIVDVVTAANCSPIASASPRRNRPRPDAMAAVVNDLVTHFSWTAQVGVGFPTVVRRGVVGSAANIDPSWIDVDADALFTEAAGVRVHMINDADAAGLAEVRFGAGRGYHGVVMMLTFGTGIGSGLFVDGVLVPNTELGHLEIDGVDAESRAAASVRKRHDLSWSQWAERVETYLRHVERLFSPDLFIIGGGASKNADQWLSKVKIDTEVVAAQMANNAGIVGAALVAPLP